MSATNSTTGKGNALELQIRDLFQREIDDDKFWVKKENCKVFWEKGYFSKDRGKEIIFDISIEIFLPGERNFSSLILIECKNYEHRVPVDDVEEFFAKVQQVAAANSKAIIASTASFQVSAREYAKSKGIGLLRYFPPDKRKWELHRSPSITAKTTSTEEAQIVSAALSQQDFCNLAFDLYLQSPIRDTNSLWDFFDDLILGSTLTFEKIRNVLNHRSKLINQVQFLKKDEIEAKAIETLSAINYVAGEVSLDMVCAYESKRTGLAVKLNVPPPESNALSSVLGRISFEPLVIEVYSGNSFHRGRERFTLAHELAHHLLDHGRHLVRESCDSNDFVLQPLNSIDGNDVACMEFQANFLAASLLMPQINFKEDFLLILRSLEISDKGFGLLYLDEQPCNRQNFSMVTGSLMAKYGVSRTAVQIRLESMGLLRVDRQPTSTKLMTK